MSERISNYEIMKQRMQPEFLKYDQNAMIEKFGLRSDADYIYVMLFSREYRISRKTGVVLWGEDEADYNVAMTHYDLLCYSKPGCTPSGELVNMHSLSTLHSGSVTLGGGLFDKMAQNFDGRTEKLSNACESLGGEPWGRGDAAYKLPMFDGLYAGVQFWDSDDEFLPSLNILVDKNLLQYMHFETMWFAVLHLLERLKEEME